MLLHKTDKTYINLKNTFMENVAVNYAICKLHVTVNLIQILAQESVWQL